MARPDFPHVVDNSLIAAFKACPQKAYKEYFQHWKSKIPSIHLHAGAAFAHGLEHARVAFYEEGASEEVAIARGVGALMRHWGDYPEDPDDPPKSFARMCGALVYYFDTWRLPVDSAVPAMLPSGRRAVEFQFVEPIEEVCHPETGDPILYAGRTDMICSLANGIFIEDDKTTSQLGPSWPKKWELRSQFSGYVWAAARAGLHVDGVLVRGVSILKTKYDHAQALTYRSQWEIQRWYHETVKTIRRMITAWETGEWDYDLADACDSYGGCQFTQVCKAKNQQEWLPLYFERRAWDPVTRKETKVLTP